jgi:uncharacterized glyoxalase superfamily protein PhnB
MAAGSVEMPGTAGARPGFSAITPYLMAPDIEPVVAFAKAVFGAEETMRTRGGAGGVHCELRIGDSMLMCDRMGTIEDAWGNEWFIATHQGAPGFRPRSG